MCLSHHHPAVPPPLFPTSTPTRATTFTRPHLHPTLLSLEGCYLLFDCPGQAELFTLHGNLRRVIDTLTNAWHYRLAVVQLVDAHLCRWGWAGGCLAGVQLVVVSTCTQAGWQEGGPGACRLAGWAYGGWANEV